MRLHSEIRAGRGLFLLLVHGILSARSQWQPSLAALSQVARPVVVEMEEMNDGSFGDTVQAGEPNVGAV